MRYQLSDLDSLPEKPVRTRDEAIGAIRRVCSSFPSVRRGAIFGSFARGEQGPDSDIDVVLAYDDSVDYRVMADVGYELVRTCGRDVDCLTSLKGVPKYVVNGIKSDGAVVYAR